MIKECLLLEIKRLNKKFFFVFGIILLLLLLVSINNDEVIVFKYFEEYILNPLGESLLFKYSDFVFPVLCGFLVLKIFSEDYNSDISMLLATYNKSKYNIIMLIRWLSVFILILTISIIFIFINYSSISEIIGNPPPYKFLYGYDPLIVILKTLPTLLWYSILPIFILVKCKNVFNSYIVLAIVIFVEVLSTDYIFPFNITANSYGFYLFVLETKNYLPFLEVNQLFFINRLFYFIMSLFLLAYSLKKSVVEKTYI